MFILIGLILLALVVLAWALSWLLFVGSAMLAALLFIGAGQFSRIEYSIVGLRRFCSTFWSLMQDSKARFQLCILTGCGVSVLRIVVWSAINYANRALFGSAAKIVGAILFPEVLLPSLRGSTLAIVGVFALEGLLIALAFWFSIYFIQIFLNVAARMWPGLENKMRNAVVNWLQKA